MGNSATTRQWGHDELASDLASYLRLNGRIAWENMQLGPAASARPDVYSMARSFVKPIPLAYEVKVSVADFRRDITTGKWQSYLDYAQGVYFAAPSGLVKRADVPPGCGLLLRGETNWSAVRAATLSPVKLPEKAYLKLLIDGIDREAARRVGDIRLRAVNHIAVRAKLGKRIAAVMCDIEGAEIRAVEEVQKVNNRIATLRAQEDEIARRVSHLHEYQRIEPERIRLAMQLGLSESAPWRAIVAQIQAELAACRRDPTIRKMHALLRSIEQQAAAVRQWVTAEPATIEIPK